MTRTKEDNVSVLVRIPRALLKEFKELSYKIHKDPYGAFSFEVVEAMKTHLIAHTIQHTKILTPINKINPSPKVYRLYQHIKKYLQEKNRLNYIPHRITATQLKEAIAACRNVIDVRTVEKWFERLDKNGCIKLIAGEEWELM